MRIREANIFDRYGFPTDQYAQAGGSVPISAEGIGMIGTATVSGMSQAEDHAFSGAEESSSAPKVEIITSGDYEYQMNEDQKTITIVHYTGDDKKLEIPSEIDDYPVAGIGAEAFRYREFKSVSFPETIRSIEHQAFEYCVISDQFQLPENVIIHEDAFSYAQLPAVVTIPQGASTEKCAFSYCDTIESLVVEPDAKIKSRSFGYCDKLTLLVCGDGCQLEDKAFEYCRDLGKVFLCGDVKTEQETFSYCGEFELTEAAADEYEALKKSAVFGSLKGS